MINTERNEKEKKKTDDYDNSLCLYHIKIDNKNKIEEFRDEALQRKLMELTNSIYLDKDDNIGQELNKFFYDILPDNKENNVLKVNYSLSDKIKENNSKHQINKLGEDYMTQIMNLKISQNFVLSRDMNEKLSVILSMFFRKIKKSKKYKSNEEIIKDINEISMKMSGFLEMYKVKNEYNKPYVVENDNEKTFFMNNVSRISKVINIPNEFNRNKHANDNNKRYCFREIKTKKKIDIPLEILVLRDKFESVKRLKLILKRDINSNETLSLEEKDIINNMFILFNIELLFPHLFEIELDLSNENILKGEISSIKAQYNKFLEKTKKNDITTNYQSENKNRIYDVHRKSVFNESNKSVIDDYDIVSGGSFSMVSSVKDSKEEEIKKQEHFIKKYMPSLEMIIIYWYFISQLKITKLINCTIPINLEDKIILMLKEKKIYLFEFNILSNVKSDSLFDITLDFNSLDNKLFSQVLSFLLKSDKMTGCRLSFFPPEEYFEPPFLLNLLLNSDKSRSSRYIKEIKINENIDIFLLRKLSEFFEVNINNFFIFFINKLRFTELSLVFEIPGILQKIDYYEIVIIKLILNMFIHIDKSEKTKFSLNSFSIIADNLSFNNRKHPFLNHFFENINIFKKKELNMQKLTFKVKMSEIRDIYKIIPYNIIYLTIGSFDIVTLESFVEYITSVEFNIHSRLRALQITLGNTLINIEECFDILERLLVESPKTLEEISIYTNIITNYTFIKKLLEKTNYNRIEKIFIQFNIKSLENSDFKKQFTEEIIDKDDKDNNFMNLYYINRNETDKEKILKIMNAIKNKYNPKFMNYYIFLELEKFMVKKSKKQNIIQYK